MSAFTQRLSAVILVAAGTAAACASSSPPANTAATAPSSSVAKARPSSAKSAAPLPTMLLPGIGMSTAKPKLNPDEDDEDLSGPAPTCSKDEDCWSKTCCPAKVPEECVHASRARNCAIIDVTCKPSPMHYTCVCDAGSCKGRLAPP